MYEPAGGHKGRLDVWIDLINDDTWAHSGQQATFYDWKDTQPDKAEQTCATMRIKWYDVQCDRQYAFVCEKTIPLRHE